MHASSTNLWSTRCVLVVSFQQLIYVHQFANEKNLTMDMSNNNKRIFMKFAATEILKKLNSRSSYQDLLLLRHRLRQYYFLYFSNKLNNNVPSSSSSMSPNLHLRMAHREGAHEEMELEPHECLLAAEDHYDEEINGFSELPSRQPNTVTRVESMNPENIMMMQMREYEFMPSINIQKITEDSILIDTVVQKDVSLTSTLFGVLEEEKKLDIVFERQYRITETLVSHTIQVKVQPDYDLHDLEIKLCTWARFST
ncbi:hypothetical protein MKX01_007644 [Papaver californicum]|nr:hypothetical protein MKX01_007644 [Papaver californicum]